MSSSFLNNFWGESGLRDIASAINQAGQKLREAFSLNRYFDEQTREILQSALSLASSHGSAEIDTEHILYALVQSPAAFAFLHKSNIDREKLRLYIEQMYLPHRSAVVASVGVELSGEVNLSPRVKAALERAFELTRELGHALISPEHVFYGLAKEPDGLGGQILRKVGVDAESARVLVIHILGKESLEPRSNTPRLDRFSRDLTALARRGLLDPVIGRNLEIETTIEILARRRKNNPILIGEPGVGKTAIVEGLAQRIINDAVPEILQNRRVIELNVTSLIAGSQFRGQFEERITKILSEALKYKDELILFIDEIHVLIGAGAGEGAVDAANIIKPALARGELNLVGATTLNEYQRHIEKDLAFERRFQPVYIDEPSIEETMAILNGLRDRFEAHHRISISDEAVKAAATLSARFISNRFLPDKAIDLLDQSAARVKIQETSKPSYLLELQSHLAQLKRERAALISDGSERRAGKLKSQIVLVQREFDIELEKWRQAVGTSSDEVMADDVALTVERLTGIPVANVNQSDREMLLQLEDRLHARIVGQDLAINAVSDAIRLGRSGLRQANRPIAALFFLGPSGTGKTELAKAIAEVVFGSQDALVRIDMSEFSEKHSVARLLGAPPGYVGYEEGGRLTERVRKRPYSVILFDEFDKAHSDAQNIMLQMLDEGRLTDSRGRVVDFHNTFVIATANISADLAESVSEEEHKSPLSSLFAPELMNRFDDFVVFKPLLPEQLKEIVRLQLRAVSAIALNLGISLEFDETLVNYLAQIKGSGARDIRRRIRTLVEAPLAKALIDGQLVPDQSYLMLIAEGQEKIAIKNYHN